MKINNFGLKKNWEEVDRVLYDIWCMNQTDTMLPKFLDTDFQRCFNNLKKRYSYKQICEKLGISD